MIDLNMNLVKDKPVTMVDIAEFLGVSRTTVGYVLSGQAERRKVAKKTAQRVRQAANMFGYVPNHWARCMQGKRTKTICVLFRNLEWNWADRVMDGIIEVTSENDYTPYIGLHEPLEEIGSGAAEVLLELIGNPGRAPIHRKISCNKLKGRRTT